MASAPPSAPLTVSELNRRSRQVLENQFGLVWVTGEISRATLAASGHWYFTLKDEGAAVDCAMFKGRAQYLEFRPENGLKVEVRARVTIYEPRGAYQLGVEQMRHAGLGALFEAFERLKARLGKEGLFDESRKRPLPPHPRAIGVVTSLAAAALRDILATLARRAPMVPVIVYPTLVQGEGAAALVARAIATANARAECDVLVVARGGGSLEDLWAFNEEAVARAIFDSEIPVVSAVGHEVDTTIADLVADYRAPTPTAAAEILVPELAGMVELVTEYQLKLGRGLRHTLELWRGRLETMGERLAGLGPLNQLRREQQRLDYLMEGLKWSMHHRLKDRKEKLNALGAHLEALSPLKVLERGYSITRNAQGKVIKKASEVKAGDTIVSKIADGTVTSEVLSAE